jgi:endonuclease YncB( thermonuclease family)
VLLCVSVFCASETCNTIKAASLFGRVIEVNSGDVITIFNLNRPVRVKLLGVDAPEMNQLFGDVAKKHLSDLVFDKSVFVEYAGIAPDSSLTGRVLFNESDIGAQMIRDGAAWFDPSSVSQLSPMHRDIYQQSEQTARSERRGLWEAENPIAPWEFVRAEALKKNPAANLNAMLPNQKSQSHAGRPTPELTSFSLIAARITGPQPGARTLSSADFAGVLGPAEHGNWRLLKPARENFSVLVPVEGMLKTIPINGGDRIVSSQVYWGRDGWSIFGVFWLKSPTYGEEDADAIKQSLTSYALGFGRSYEENKNAAQLPTFACPLENETDISTGGFTGLEFDLKSCTIPARARVFTRVVDGERQMYLAAVFYLEEDDNVSRFIKSFNIGPPPKAFTRRK